MKKGKKILSLLLSLSLILSLTIQTAFAAGTTNVSMSVTPTTVNVGETVTVVISNKLLTTQGFGIYLEFNEELLECTAITGVDGDEYLGLHKTSGKTTWVDATLGDNVADTNSDGIFSFGLISGSEIEFAEGVVATLTFTAKAAGNVNIVLNEDTSGATHGYKGVGASETVTINGPHIHVFDQQVSTDDFKASGATCTSPALYYYSCTCSEKGTSTYAVGAALGHDYTQQIQDAAHLKTEATKCTEYNIYWYDCSRCDVNAKDDANATDKYYTSTIAGGHLFNEPIENTAHLVTGSGADCQNAKEYYYDCAYCDEIGTTTWTSNSVGAHHESAVWTTNDTQHWKVCDVNNCGVVIDGTTGNHTSTGANQATCQAKAVCDTCGVSYGSLGSHDMATGNDWSKDATGHWYECKTSGCGETSGFAAHNPDHQGGATEEYPILCTVCGYEIEAQLGHTHVFNKEVATDEYEATPATCKDQATYYKSCKCGLAGTETFASGALADHKWDPATCTEPKTCSVCHLTDGTANGHTEGTEWKRDDNNHWHICKKCDAVIDASVEAHNPDHQGGATEEYPILCTECGYEMEAQLIHTHVYDKEVVAEKYLVSEATCQKYAVYKLSCKCGAAGTETFEDVNAGYADHKWNSAWTKDETGHWHECKTSGCEEVNEYAAHTPGEDWKRDKNNHWHICEECNAVIADSKEAHTDADSNEVCDVCDYQMKAEKSESSGRVEKYGWLETDGNWYYHLGTKKAKGWYEVKNYWYYFKKNYPNAGAMQTGWIFDEGRWYYLGENGVMKTGWRLLGGKWYYLGQSGAMKTGWFFDPNYNAWYYLHDENGDMLVNTTTPDGYYVGADGKWVQ